MNSRQTFIRNTLALVVILAIPGAASADSDRVQTPETLSPMAPEGVLDLLYQATGVTNSTTIATSVHCTNVGTTDGWITLRVLNWGGTSVCSILNHLIASEATATLSTQNTAVYGEDDWCTDESVVNQGLLTVWAEPTGSTEIICTAQIIDSEALTPTFATTLTLYRR